MLTLGLAAACLGVQLWAELDGRSARASAAAGLERAAAYLVAHPHLEVVPALEVHLGVERVEERRAELERRRVARGGPPVPDGVRRRQQEQLDRILAEALWPLEQLPARRLGLRAASPEAASFASHLLVHGGWLHLAGNLALLLLLGTVVERTWGSIPFAGLALGASAAAGVALVATSPDLEADWVGTSGLLAGLLAAVVVGCPGAARRERPALVAGAGWLSLPFWLGVEWSPAAAQGLGATSFPLSSWALAGGLGAGLAGGLLARAVRPRDGAAAATWLRERAARERDAGRHARAFRMLTRALREDPDDVATALALFEVARKLGRNAPAAAALLRVIEEDVRAGDGASAISHWLKLGEIDVEPPVEPALAIRLVPLLRQAGHDGSAIYALQLALRRARGARAAPVAARVARAALELDPRVAEEAAWRALGSLEIGLEERQSLEALLGRIARPRGSFATEAPAAEIPALLEESAPIETEKASEGDPDTEPWDLPALPDETAPARPEPIELDLKERPLEAVEARPLELTEDGLRVDLDRVGKKRLPYRHIQAIGVAAIQGQHTARAVLLIDLVLNWHDGSAEPLKLVRLRGDRFDPLRFAPGADSSMDALRAFVAGLLERTGAVPLPDPQAARGLPFAAFATLSDYQRVVLMAGTTEEPESTTENPEKVEAPKPEDDAIDEGAEASYGRIE